MHSECGWFSRLDIHPIEQNFYTGTYQNLRYKIKITHRNTAGNNNNITLMNSLLYDFISDVFIVRGNPILNCCSSRSCNLGIQLVSITIAYLRNNRKIGWVNQLIACTYYTNNWLFFNIYLGMSYRCHNCNILRLD